MSYTLELQVTRTKIVTIYKMKNDLRSKPSPQSISYYCYKHTTDDLKLLINGRYISIISIFQIFTE